jgi:hypothetical protein
MGITDQGDSCSASKDAGAEAEKEDYEMEAEKADEEMGKESAKGRQVDEKPCMCARPGISAQEAYSIFLKARLDLGTEEEEDAPPPLKRARSVPDLHDRPGEMRQEAPASGGNDDSAEWSGQKLLNSQLFNSEESAIKSDELLNSVEKGAEKAELGAKIGAESPVLGAIGPLAGESIESQRGSDIPRKPLRNFVGCIGDGAVSSEGEDLHVVGAADDSSLHLSSGRGSGEEDGEEEEEGFNANAVNEEEEYGMMCQDPDEQRQLVSYQGISLAVCFPVCLATHLRKGSFSCALRLRGWTALQS